MKVTQFSTLTMEPLPRPTPPVSLLVEGNALISTQETLRSTSAGVREALVLWAGRTLDNCRAVVSHMIEPKCFATNDLLVVPYDERVQVAAYLRQERLLVFADLHTHPASAYLSTADKSRPFSIRSGFYALVVPDFGARQALAGWRIYEAIDGDWKEVRLEDRVRPRRV